MPEFLALDVTMSQAKVLHLLAVRREESMSGLAAALGVTLPTVSGLVDRLVEHGLMERHGHADDRRHVMVALTERGRRVTDAFYEVGRRHLGSLLAVLDDEELTCLARGLGAVVAAAERLGQASPASPPDLHRRHAMGHERTAP